MTDPMATTTTETVTLRELECRLVIRDPGATYESIHGPEAIAGAFRALWPSPPQEIFAVFFLDAANQICGIQVTKGIINESLVHPRELFRAAIIHNANCIVAAHNHPSGELSPSHEDIHVTGIIERAGKVLGIQLLDHVIVGRGDEYTSMRDMGLITT